MLINKKFLALALLPIFGACVVNDTDDDVGGTDTDISTTDPATTDPATTDPATTDPATTEPTTTTDPATTDPGTDSETEADTSATETDTDTGGGGFCQQSCAEAVDCCNAADPNCEAGLGTYPYDLGCDGGVCTFGGCTEDDQCTFGGVLVGYICDEEIGVCGFGCADDAECQAQIGMETFTCNGTYCEAGEVPGCETDDDCFGFGVCDVATGVCGCSADDQCGEGFVCGDA